MSAKMMRFFCNLWPNPLSGSTEEEEVEEEGVMKLG